MNSPFFTPSQLEIFQQVTFQHILVEQDRYVFRITLNRPEKRNAFNLLMANEIAYAIGYANMLDSVRCLVIKANGSVFCAGADLNAFAGNDDKTVRSSLPEPTQKVNLGEAFSALNKPSVAQIAGPVLAGGFLILAGVTFAYSTKDAHFSLPEVQRGIWPMQVMASLAQILAPRKVLEMCITGARYSADDALKMGLLTKIADSENIENEVDQLVSSITSNAPLAISKGMDVFRRLQAPAIHQTYRLLQEELESLLLSQDAKEGILAFREKRSPEWQNR